MPKTWEEETKRRQDSIKPLPREAVQSQDGGEKPDEPQGVVIENHKPGTKAKAKTVEGVGNADT